MFTIKVVPGGENNELYHVVIDSPNGRRMFSSETYASKSNARRAARKFGDHVSGRYFQLDADLL